VRQLDVRFQVAGGPRQPFFGNDALFRLLALLQDFLRLFLVPPEIRLAGFLLESGQTRAGGRYVKGSSGRERCALGALRSDVRGLRESWFGAQGFVASG